MPEKHARPGPAAGPASYAAANLTPIDRHPVVVNPLRSTRTIVPFTDFRLIPIISGRQIAPMFIRTGWPGLTGADGGTYIRIPPAEMSTDRAGTSRREGP